MWSRGNKMTKKTPYGDTVQIMDLKNDLVVKMQHIENCKKFGTDPYDPDMRAVVDSKGKVKAIMYFQEMEKENAPKNKTPLNNLPKF